jgi:hypothetical protein
LAGPFEGLKYPERAAGSAWAPKLLGTYELELVPVIEEIVSRGYGFVIDVGAAEGYYAVGLARRMPGAEIVCFEKEEEARSLLAWFAAENGVASRLQIHGVATASALAKTLEPREGALVICDAEGAEIELLDPGVAPALRRSDILVELHDFLDGDVAAILSGRFAPTHEITEVRARPRRVGDCPSRARFGRAQTLALLDESRPDGMRWFWMRRRRDGIAVFDRDGDRSID